MKDVKVLDISGTKMEYVKYKSNELLVMRLV